MIVYLFYFVNILFYYLPDFPDIPDRFTRPEVRLYMFKWCAKGKISYFLIKKNIFLPR